MQVVPQCDTWLVWGTLIDSKKKKKIKLHQGWGQFNLILFVVKAKPWIWWVYNVSTHGNNFQSQPAQEILLPDLQQPLTRQNSAQMGFLAAENQPCSLQSQTPSLDGLSRVWISDTILSGSVTKRKYIPEPHSRVASPAHMQSEPVLICDQGILGLGECGQQNGAAGMSLREFQCSNTPQTWLKDFANLKTTLPSFVCFFPYKITSLKWFLRCHHGRTGLMLFPGRWHGRWYCAINRALQRFVPPKTYSG